MLSKSETGEQNVTKEAQQTQQTQPPAKRTKQNKAKRETHWQLLWLELAGQLAFLMASPSRWDKLGSKGSDETESGAGSDGRCCSFEHVQEEIGRLGGGWPAGDAFVEFVIVANKLWADSILVS